MEAIIYISLIFSPLVASIIYFYLRSKYESGFGNLLLKAYLAGIFCTLIYYFFFFIFRILDLTEPPNNSLKRILLFAFVIIGFGSELSKFIVYRYYVIPHPVINKPIHAITFSVITALGFSTITQIFYCFNLFELQSYYPKIMYSFVNVPSNLIFAIIMGFFVGMSRFINTRFLYSIIGLFGAAFFHGILKFCLITKEDYKLLSLFAFGSALIVIVLIIKAAFTNPETLT